MAATHGGDGDSGDDDSDDGYSDSDSGDGTRNKLKLTALIITSIYFHYDLGSLARCF